MFSQKKRLMLQTAGGLVAALIALTASAQPANDWPARPVTIVVGFTAGGPTDAVARILAEQLTTKLNQNFVVDNKPGASGGIAAVAVKRAAPDGYTLMFGSSSTLSITPHLQKNVGYDPLRDFTAIGLVASYPYFLVTPVSSSLTSLDELIEQGRNRSADLSYGSAGNGAVNHLAGEWFKHVAKIKAVHIPYKGDSAAIVDLAAGRLDFAFLAGTAVLPHIRSGKLRVLASASATPGRGGEGVITLGDSRFKGFAAEPWNGLMGPAGIPQPIVTRLNAAVNEIMNRKDVIDRLASLEAYPLTGTPQQFTAHIKDQSERWASVIKTTDIKGE